MRVYVDASQGPQGGAPARIDRRFYGMNIADWETGDYRPELHPSFVQYLAALQPGILRWPAGHTSQAYQWERAPEAQGASRVLTAAHVDAFLRLSREVGAEPLLAVNLKTGTPSAAADLVRYVNVERGWNVTWWQIGNEPDHRDGLTDSPEQYAKTYLAFARAMREVDPDIRLVGGEIMTGAHVLGSNGRHDWLTPILEIAGHEMDAIGWHYYPLDSAQQSEKSSAYATRENLYQEHAPDWRPAGMSFADEVFPALRAKAQQHAPGAEVWVTEMAEDSANGGTPDLVGTHAAALWTADILGRFAAHAPEAIAKFVFKSGSSHRFTLLDQDYAPRPAYSVYWLYANHWGDRVVATTSDDVAWVNAHAALRPDGRLALILVNKAEQDAQVGVEIDGFSPVSASRFLLSGDDYASKRVTINGIALDEATLLGDGAPAPEPLDLAEAKAVTVPARSVLLLLYEP